MKTLITADYQTIIKTALKVENPQLAERGFVEVQFVTKQTSQTLNQKYRAKNTSTDVLSFPLYHHTELKAVITHDEEPILLGSLIICKSIVRTRAQEEGMGYDERLSWTIKHGLKHLLGYDHNPDGSSWFPVPT